MVKSVDFAVRNSTGGVSYGMVAGEGVSDFIQVGAGDEISLNLRKSSILKYMRDGNDLEIVLVDGREIRLSGFYNADAKLYISSDGELSQVVLEEGGDGVIYADYGQAEVIGKWSPNDQLAFLDGDDVLAAAGADDTTGMAMFAPALLGGLGGAGAAAAAAGAVVIGGGLLDGGGSGGGSGGGGTTTIVPTVNNPNADTTLTTNTANPQAQVSGTGEAGSTVVVVLGDKTLETKVGTDGTWSVTFQGPSFPSDGDLTSTVTVTAPGGKVYELDGPDFLIDMTPPAVVVTEGAQSTHDVENAAEYQNGISVSGTGEAKADIRVVVAHPNGGTVEAVTKVGDDGTWTVTFSTTQLPGGTYTANMTITATDPLGNATTLNDKLVVDTEATLTQTMTQGGADGVVSAAELAMPVVIGGAVEAGSTVSVTLANGTVLPASVSNGTWSLQIPSQYLTGTGTLGYSVVAKDQYQNTSQTLTGVVRYDTEMSLTNAGTTANTLVKNDAYVNAAEGASGVVITGTVEANAQSVTVTLPGHGNVQIPATITGTTWSATIPASFIANGEGTLNYTVNGFDAYGNSLSTPVQGSVLYDTHVNQFTLNGATGGADGVVSGAEKNAVMIGGQVEAGSTVVVTLPGNVTVTAQVSGTTWSAQIPASAMNGEGSLSYSVVATDGKGNVSQPLAGSVSYDTVLNNLTHTTSDPTQPVAGGVADAVVNAAEGADGILITGTIEAGARSVTLTLPGHGNVPISGTISGTTWSAVVPSSYIANGEGTLNYTVNGTDAFGNALATPQTGSVRYDTVVRNFTVDGNETTDDVVNATEAANGFVISGTVEANSTVRVELENGAFREVQANDSGIWTTTFDIDDLSGFARTVEYTVTARDAAGNVSVLSSDDGGSPLSFMLDLTPPDAPQVTDFTNNGNGTRALYTDFSEGDHYVVSTVRADGTVLTVKDSAPQSVGGEDLYDFGTTRVPDGQFLVVTDTDTAGNEASTLLVVNANTPVTLNLNNPGLAEFDFASIDLSYATANVTITAAQLEGLTGPANDLVIHGDAADHVTAAGALDTGSDTMIGGQKYSIYTLGDEGNHLIVDDTIQLTTTI